MDIELSKIMREIGCITEEYVKNEGAKHIPGGNRAVLGISKGVCYILENEYNARNGAKPFETLNGCKYKEEVSIEITSVLKLTPEYVDNLPRERGQSWVGPRKKYFNGIIDHYGKHMMDILDDAIYGHASNKSGLCKEYRYGNAYAYDSELSPTGLNKTVDRFVKGMGVHGRTRGEHTKSILDAAKAILDCVEGTVLYYRNVAVIKEDQGFIKFVNTVDYVLTSVDTCKIQISTCTAGIKHLKMTIGVTIGIRQDGYSITK